MTGVQTCALPISRSGSLLQRGRIEAGADHGLGSILGMVASGLLRDRIGTPALFAAAAAAALAGGVLMAAIPSRRRL